MRRPLLTGPSAIDSSSVAAQQRLSRRGFLAGTGITAAGLLGAGALGGCSKASLGGGGGPKPLTIANWPDYIDTGDDGTVARFQQATGISVNYTEPIEDNLSYFESILPEMSTGQVIDADLMVLTGDMAARVIGLGWAEQLPMDAIPNAVNLVPELVRPGWDLLGRFTLPWQSGMIVIAYDASKTGFELTGPNDLLDDRLKGRVSLLDEYSDTLGVFGLDDGVDVALPRLAAFDEVFARLTEATKSGQIGSYLGTDQVDAMESGDVVASLAWAGDVTPLADENPDIKLVVPEQGTIFFSDVMLVPKGSPNLDAAAQWMNFVYDPSNAARVTEYVEYFSPVIGTDKRLLAMGGEAAALVDNPMVFPTEETRRTLQAFGEVSEIESTEFEERYAELKGLVA